MTAAVGSQSGPATTGWSRVPGSGLLGRSRRARYWRRVARRMLSAALAGAAVWAALGAVRPPAPAAGVPVLVATRDLMIGSRLGPDDIQVRAVPDEVAAWAAPGGPREVSAVVGRVLAAPVGKGEIVTDRQVHATTWLAGAPTGTVAMTVPLQSSGVLEVLRPGDRVRVLAPGTGALVATGVVLTCRSAAGVSCGGSGAVSAGSSGPDSSGWPGAGGALGVDRAPVLMLAVSEAQATALAAALPPEGLGGFVVALTG